MGEPTFDIARLFGLLASHGGAPKLTWYGPDYERIELSGAVLTNWLNKTTNLLVEELDAEPGIKVEVDLPVHWRTLVWEIAVLRTGATVSLTGLSDSPLTVTAHPENHTGANELIVVTLGALARKFPGVLPSGAIDAAGAVMTYSDALGFVPAIDLGSAALVAPSLDVELSFDQLREWVLHNPQGESLRDQRVLLTVSDNSWSTNMRVLHTALSTWHLGGSLVLCGSDISGELELDAARLDRISQSERITRHIRF